VTTSAAVITKVLECTIFIIFQNREMGAFSLLPLSAADIRYNEVHSARLPKCIPIDLCAHLLQTTWLAVTVVITQQIYLIASEIIVPSTITRWFTSVFRPKTADKTKTR
jgi:hypothetical protein